MVKQSESAASVLAVARAKGCSHPVRLVGSIEVTDQHSGDVVHRWSTEHHTPAGVAYVPCKTRRAAKCPSCATLYQRDAFRLIAEGLRGGEFVPESVREHPALFVTFTAPSFGPVHTQRTNSRGEVLPCRPRRAGESCPHGRELSCGARHADDDPRLGQAICPDCFDYQGAVLWNAHAGKLWRATRVAIDRALAKCLDLSASKMRKARCRTQYVKVAEFQARGLVHFHVAIRLDATDGTAPDVDLEDLADAIRAAHSQTDVASGDGRRIGWGDQLDIKIIGAHIGRERLAGYFAKYATKSSDARGLLGSRIRNDAQLACLPVNDHLARLVRTSWALASHHPDSGLDRWAHQFGFRGHFLTKSRSWSTTFKALRQRRADFHADAERQSWEALAPAEHLVVESHWEFAGTGYRSAAEAQLAALRRPPPCCTRSGRRCRLSTETTNQKRRNVTGYQPLEAARMYLRVLCRMADDAGDWQERRLLGPLHDVADMVCRIGEYGDSHRYRADKAGTLVSAALKLRSVALERYAGADDNDQVFSKVLGLQESLDNAISRVMWVFAGWKRNDGGEFWRSDAEDLRLALRRLSDWAENITELALPDPTDEAKEPEDQTPMKGEV